jgi:hypothetical protein
MDNIEGLLTLGDKDKEAALNMGLLQAGLGILARNTDRRNPMPAIAAGGMAGLQGYQQALQQAEAQKLNEIRRAELLRKLQEEQRQKALITQYGEQITDPNERTRFMLNPTEYIKDMTELKVMPEGSTLTRGGKEVFASPRKPMTRDYISGMERITQEYDNETKTWREIGRGPAFAKQVPSIVSVGGAPSMTEVQDPKNPSRMLRVDAKVYQGGSLGDVGVIGVSGKEPTAAAKEGKVESGKQQLASTLDDMKAAYDALQTKRAIPSTTRGAMSNVMNYFAGSTPGQVVGRMTGSEEQQQRDLINSSRMLLLNDIKAATGMSAQQMNSNIELQNWLRSLGDPNIGYETAVGIIESIRRKYVDGANTGRESKGAISSVGGAAPDFAAAARAELERRKGAK